MEKFKPGQRVAALQWIDKDTREMELIGYGIYQGRQIPDDEAVSLCGISLRKIKGSRACVLLDSDFRVYDTECSIISEATAKQFESYFNKVTHISPDQIKQQRSEKKYR